tara:strand:- start:235 stop:450 length:216 start_codon:yes stop_codon:yes gene_type:complete
MSLAQIKNLNRRLDNLVDEAIHELDKACGNELWRSVGFDAFDGLEDVERRAIANYYYGQLQVARDLQSILN